MLFRGHGRCAVSVARTSQASPPSWRAGARPVAPPRTGLRASRDKEGWGTSWEVFVCGTRPHSVRWESTSSFPLRTKEESR